MICFEDWYLAKGAWDFRDARFEDSKPNDANRGNARDAHAQTV